VFGNAGAALAVAVLARFLERGARVVATTHPTELKLFGADHPHGANPSVRFDPETYEPTYQLDVGSPVPSPDGHQVAFLNGNQVWLMNADGTRPTALTNLDPTSFPYSCRIPAWTRS